MIDGAYRVTSPYGEFWVWPNDIVSDYIRDGKFWDAFLLPVFDSLVVDVGATVIDIGANIGIFSIYAAKRGHTVHAFEVSKDNFEVLNANVKLNRVEHFVKTYNVALFDSEVDMENLERTKGEHGGYAIIPATDPSHILCKSKALDSYNFNKVHLIKIDAQGCDLHIMKGAINTIKTHKPVICYEVEGTAVELNVNGDEYSSFIEQIGYKEEMLCNSGSSWDFVARPRTI